MSVIEFPKPARDWRTDELQQLVSLADAARFSWDTGTTERGEPQFYVIGPAPDHGCVLCVSRLAQGYVLEDGTGRLIGEAPALDRFAVEAARAAIRGGRSFVVARDRRLGHAAADDRGKVRADPRGERGNAGALRAAARGVYLTRPPPRGRRAHRAALTRRRSRRASSCRRSPSRIHVLALEIACTTEVRGLRCAS